MCVFVALVIIDLSLPILQENGLAISPIAPCHAWYAMYGPIFQRKVIFAMDNSSNASDPMEEEVQEAERIVMQILEYRWLRDEKSWYSVIEVAEKLGIGRESVRKWCESGDIPGAMNFQPQQVGWRIPRSGLLLFLARIRKGRTRRESPIGDLHAAG